MQSTQTTSVTLNRPLSVDALQTWLHAGDLNLVNIDMAINLIVSAINENLPDHQFMTRVDNYFMTLDPNIYDLNRRADMIGHMILILTHAKEVIATANMALPINTFMVDYDNVLTLANNTNYGKI